jgi:hypothetical protein
MRKILLTGALLIGLTGAFFTGGKYGSTDMNSQITERVLTHVVSTSVDGGKFIRVQNVNADSDIIILDPIKGVHVGDRVQVDFNQDEVVQTKIVGDN